MDVCPDPTPVARNENVFKRRPNDVCAGPFTETCPEASWMPDQIHRWAGCFRLSADSPPWKVCHFLIFVAIVYFDVVQGMLVVGWG